jgi:riboflavin kinase/FMN adenylyltransferase
MMDKINFPCSLSGEVVRGNRIGRQLGFPTANLALTDDGVTDGVYAVRAVADGTRYDGVANVGSRPTVTDRAERFLEVYLFGFDGDLYGKTIEVELVAFLRPEQKFTSVEALRRQIEADKRQAEQLLKA